MDDKRTIRGITGNFDKRENSNKEISTKQKNNKEKIKNWFLPLLGEEWFEVLKKEFTKQYMVNLGMEIARQRKLSTIYPESNKVFEAFKVTPYSKVKLVIIGQSPYHNGSAVGLAFSNNGHDIKTLNPSLQKIFEYLEFSYDLDTIEFPPFTDYTLNRWTEQGTLLLNRVLTVKKGKASSHRNIGWEVFTNRVIQSLNYSKRKIVFMLWGNDAKSLSKLIDTKKHFILCCEHPAAACYANRGWNAKKCFQRTNEIFDKLGEKRILW